MAPRQDDLAARMDPSRARARGFNTGRAAARGGGNEDSSAIWHETAEQKQKRLANEVLGISTSKSAAAGPVNEQRRSGLDNKINDADTDDQTQERKVCHLLPHFVACQTYLHIVCFSNSFGAMTIIVRRTMLHESAPAIRQHTIDLLRRKLTTELTQMLGEEPRSLFAGPTSSSKA